VGSALRRLSLLVLTFATYLYIFGAALVAHYVPCFNELYALLHSYLLSNLTDVSQSCVGTRVLLEYLIAMMLFEAIQVFTELFKTMVTVNGGDDSIFQGEFTDVGTNFRWYSTFMEITTNTCSLNRNQCWLHINDFYSFLRKNGVHQVILTACTPISVVTQ